MATDPLPFCVCAAEGCEKAAIVGEAYCTKHSLPPQVEKCCEKCFETDEKETWCLDTDCPCHKESSVKEEHEHDIGAVEYKGRQWCKNCPEIKPHLTPVEGDWEREFYEKFGADKIWVVPSKENVETVLELWSFIRTHLKEAEERGREEAVAYIESKMPTVCNDYSTDEMTKLLEAAKSPKE